MTCKSGVFVWKNAAVVHVANLLHAVCKNV